MDNPEPGIVVDSQFGMLSGSGRKSRSTSRSGHSHSPRGRSISVQRVRETRSLNSPDTIKQSPNDELLPPPRFEIPYPIISGSNPEADSSSLRQGRGRKSKRDSLGDSNLECYR